MLYTLVLLSTNCDHSSYTFHFIPELIRHIKGQSINFEDENFVDSKSSAKTAKITYPENFYVYGINRSRNTVILSLTITDNLVHYLIKNNNLMITLFQESIADMHISVHVHSKYMYPVQDQDTLKENHNNRTVGELKNSSYRYFS